MLRPSSTSPPQAGADAGDPFRLPARIGLAGARNGPDAFGTKRLGRAYRLSTLYFLRRNHAGGVRGKGAGPPSPPAPPPSLLRRSSSGRHRKGSSP